jgi:ribosomal-protein-alanine N-acetyltransferase
MRLDDLPEVRSIDLASFSIPWPESAYRYELTQNPNSILWVAENSLPDGERHIVGMVVVWIVLDEAHIATIAVHPEHRHEGIGRGLLATAMQQSIQRGAKKAMLEVRASNDFAQSLYRQFGFEVVNRRPKYYRDNLEDALLMNLEHLDGAYLHWLESRGWTNLFPISTD